MCQDSVLEQCHTYPKRPCRLLWKFELVEILQEQWQSAYNLLYQQTSSLGGRRLDMRPLHPCFELCLLKGPPCGQCATVINANHLMGALPCQQEVARVPICVEHSNVEARYGLCFVELNDLTGQTELHGHPIVLNGPTGLLYKKLYGAPLSDAFLVEARASRDRDTGLSASSAVNHVGSLLTQRTESDFYASSGKILAIQWFENGVEWPICHPIALQQEDSMLLSI
mmetsp:Transcript_2589/g.6614  ORF Transcript_2589/g.6614 Transcript_2589/m.6614 type:complete len:226 (+) Transcript_2589:376-1053(+)